jgi:hypothetical protein
MVPFQRRRNCCIPSLPILKNAMATCQGRSSAQAVVAFMVALTRCYHLLGAKDGKKRFADTALALSKALSLCCTLNEAKAVREEVAALAARHRCAHDRLICHQPAWTAGCCVRHGASSSTWSSLDL